MKVSVKVHFILPYVYKQHTMEKYVMFDNLELEGGTQIWVNL